MMEVIKVSVREFNTGQHESRSIKDTFILAGQHPWSWSDCQAEHKAHLDSLSKLSLYGVCNIKDVLKQDKESASDRKSVHVAKITAGTTTETSTLPMHRCRP